MITSLLLSMWLHMPLHRQYIPTPDTKFWVIAAVTMAAMVMDYEVTFVALDRGAREANPLMRPLVTNGRAVTYGVMVPLHLLMLWSAHHRRGEDRWWLPLAVSISGHGVGIGFGLRFK